MSDDEPHLLDFWGPDDRRGSGGSADLTAQDAGPAGSHRRYEQVAPSAAPHARQRRSRRRRGVGGALSLLVLLVLAAGLATGGVVGYHRLREHFVVPDYAGSGTGAVTVTIAQGQTASDIAQTMVNRGVVKSVTAFRKAAENNPRSVSIQPGTYKLKRHMQASAALTLLLDPSSRVILRFTVPEVFTVAQVLARIAQDTPISLASLKRAAAAPGRLGLPSWSNGRLEGFLFPATYTLQPGTSATQALRAMTAKFVTEATAAQLVRRAAKLNTTPYRLLTVASIVEKEGIGADFSKISRVVRNRLASGKRLQLDSTLNYVLHARTGHPTTAQTKISSPYNTYRVPGLPPTPISDPGLASLRAAGNPAAGNWIYFVTISKDGHAFFTNSYQAFLNHKRQAQRDGVY